MSVGAVKGEYAQDGADLTPLAELASAPAAARLLSDAGRTIGRVLADLVNCLNPAAIILGGELGLARVRESIDRHASQAGANAATIAPGRLGPRAEPLGAGATAVREPLAASAAI